MSVSPTTIKLHADARKLVSPSLALVLGQDQQHRSIAACTGLFLPDGLTVVTRSNAILGAHRIQVQHGDGLTSDVLTVVGEAPAFGFVALRIATSSSGKDAIPSWNAFVSPSASELTTGEDYFLVPHPQLVQKGPETLSIVETKTHKDLGSYAILTTRIGSAQTCCPLINAQFSCIGITCTPPVLKQAIPVAVSPQALLRSLQPVELTIAQWQELKARVLLRSGEGLYVAALQACSDKRYQEAFDYLGLALKQREDFPEALFLSGFVSYELGDHSRACTYYLKTVALKPDYPKAYHNLGVIQFEQGHIAEAIASFERATSHFPNDAEAHYKLGWLLSETQKIDEARAAYQRAIAIDPSFDEALRNLALLEQEHGTSASRIATLEQAVLQDPQAVETSYQLGVLYCQTGRHQDAVIALKKATTLDPTHAAAFYHLGIAYDAAERYQDAAMALEVAEKLDPTSYQAINNLGVAYRKLGQKDDARDAFARAVTAKPDFAEGYFNLALTCLNLGQTNEAIAAFAQAAHYNPKDEEAFLQLGTLYTDSGKLDEAVASFTKAVEANAESFRGFNGLGVARLRQERMPEAIKALLIAKRLNPRIPDIYYNLAIAYAAIGQRDLALEHHQALQSIDPMLADTLWPYIQSPSSSPEH